MALHKSKDRRAHKIQGKPGELAVGLGEWFCTACRSPVIWSLNEPRPESCPMCGTEIPPPLTVKARNFQLVMQTDDGELADARTGQKFGAKRQKAIRRRLDRAELKRSEGRTENLARGFEPNESVRRRKQHK